MGEEIGGLYGTDVGVGIDSGLGGGDAFVFSGVEGNEPERIGGNESGFGTVAGIMVGIGGKDLAISWACRIICFSDSADAVDGRRVKSA